jgi:hypothetical protein
MRYQSHRRQHLPIGSGITEAAAVGQVMLALRVIWLSGVWDEVHQRYLASKPLPASQGDIAKGAQRRQQAAELLGRGAITHCGS